MAQFGMLMQKVALEKFPFFRLCQQVRWSVMEVIRKGIDLTRERSKTWAGVPQPHTLPSSCGQCTSLISITMGSAYLVNGLGISPARGMALNNKSWTYATVS